MVDPSNKVSYELADQLPWGGRALACGLFQYCQLAGGQK
jgi:hypothetical protein